jgi:hypothetical protein
MDKDIDEIDDIDESLLEDNLSDFEIEDEGELDEEEGLEDKSINEEEEDLEGATEPDKTSFIETEDDTDKMFDVKFIDSILDPHKEQNIATTITDADNIIFNKI